MKVTLLDIVDYEVRASWWACYVSYPPLQTLAGKYFAWKAKRKFKRWQESLKWQVRFGRKNITDL